MRRTPHHVYADLGWLVALLLAAWIALDQVAPAPPLALTGRAKIERLAAGDTLWDLSATYAGRFDRHQWCSQVKLVNGFTDSTILPADRLIVVEDWRDRVSRAPAAFTLSSPSAGVSKGLPAPTEAH